ncbi:MAG: carbohydrate kinase family protein [Bacteroidales bacterium]|nr:carbohydrate kinase family protein [Bacteroidales bacterium]
MNKEFDVIVVGELNVDLILNDLDRFPEVGKEILARQMTLTLGSSAAIFASNISSLGARVAFIGKIGKDKFGEVVLESLHNNNVDVSMIKMDENCGTGATIVLNVEEDRANTTYPGAMELLTINDISQEDLGRAKHLHFSSFFLQPGMREGVGKLFRTAQELGLTTSFDMQWDPEEEWDLDIADILPHVNVFLPNENELMYLSGKNDLIEAINFIKKYSDVLAIKKGNQGSMVSYRDEIMNLPAYLNKNVVDAIGAGDSFNAGFIFKYILGNSIPDCQQYGNLTGAVSTTAAGGTTAFQNYENFRQKARDVFGFTV